ncbi:MAG: cysteine--tRNA ligase [Actinomycetota bacterium]|nr:cysteine--tRNA ligase [Actinomycetota bacterium]
MRLYDTATRRLVPFVAGRTVRVYVCGITPYDASHLGHAFTYSCFDALVRYLEHTGHRVRYARNVTDVDDDILRKARELGMDYLELAGRETARFDRDLAGLGLRAPDTAPRATAAVPAIVAAVDGLVRRGAAYALDDGRVYFDTGSTPGFGALSGLDRPTMLREFGAKGGDPQARGKCDALDFLLWQPSADDEPNWPSPWGPGRPGWHIECSVMAMEELGGVVDIHGGGVDLIFPHHEAERVQAEELTGQRPFARLWLHAGMVGLGEEKMAKSRGNLVFITDLLECYEGAAVRRYLLEHHYRSTWTYAAAGLDDAAAAYKRWVEAAGSPGRRDDLRGAFHSAMADDLDTPGALAVLDEAARDGAGVTLRELGAVLGFDLPGG